MTGKSTKIERPRREWNRWEYRCLKCNGVDHDITLNNSEPQLVVACAMCKSGQGVEVDQMLTRDLGMRLVKGGPQESWGDLAEAA